MCNIVGLNKKSDFCSNKKVHVKSQLLSLSPYLDEENVIRGGGRLPNSNLPYMTQYPAILTSRHLFTKLIIKHTHKKHLHMDLQVTLAIVREQYWPLNAKDSVSQILRNCIPCFGLKPKETQHIMFVYLQRELLLDGHS